MCETLTVYNADTKLYEFWSEDDYFNLPECPPLTDCYWQKRTTRETRVEIEKDEADFISNGFSMYKEIT